MKSLNLNRQLCQVCTAEQYLAFHHDRLLPEYDARLMDLHRTDAHWTVVEAGCVKARCSLWWRHAPPIASGRAGLIGHYAAADDDSAQMLLQLVCRELRRKGCTFAIGPMDQNTWRDYRFVIEPGDRPPFFLEPVSVPEWHQQFRRHGFAEIARYCSSLADDLTICSPRLARVKQRMAASGVTIRPLEQDHVDRELKQIHAVVQVAFRDNPYYVPVSETDFLAMYAPLQHSVPTDLILVAEHDGRVIGFVFAVPDLLQAQRGSAIDTVVVKTFGVRPTRAYAGVGQVLLEDVHHRAAARGFRFAIHALVRESATMNRMVDRYGVPFRRYALFGKELSG